MNKKNIGNPLTIEQLREMDGKPVYCPDDGIWGIISVDSTGRWAGIPFFRGRTRNVNIEYDIESRGMSVYAYPPAHIDREAWISVEERLPEDEKGVLAYYGFDRGDGDFGMRFMGTLSYFAHDPNPHWQHESTGLTVTHWMPLPEPPAELEKRMGVR